MTQTPEPRAVPAGHRRFEGRTVVVTGGAGGTGREVSAAFAAEGASVAVVDVQQSAVDETVASLKELGTPSRGFVVDVRDASAVESLMASVHSELGGPHVLVTLAGGSLGTPRDLPDINFLTDYHYTLFNRRLLDHTTQATGISSNLADAHFA